MPVTRSDPWRVQPQYLTRPAGGPLSRGLVFLWNGKFPSTPPHSLAGPISTLVQPPLKHGVYRGSPVIGSDFNGSSQYVKWGLPAVESNPSEVTLFALVGADVNNDFTTLVLNNSGTNTPMIRIWNNSSASKWGGDWRDDAGTLVRLNPTAATTYDGRLYFVVYVGRSGTGQKEIWLNGVLGGTSTTSVGTTTLQTTTVGAFTGSSTIQFQDGLVALAGIYNRALSPSEVIALSQNPWQVFAPLPRRIYFGIAAGAGGVNGSLTKTEANDTVAGAGNVAVSGSLTKTEANDTLAGAGNVAVSGSLTKTEANDTLAGAGNVAVSGSLTKTEAGDTLAGAGNVAVSGSLTKTEAADTVAGTGVVGAAPVTGSLTKTEANDTVAGAGNVAVSGSLTKTEAGDTLAGAGNVAVNGALTKTEAGDTLAGAGNVAVSGSLTKTEANDTVAGAGNVAVSGSLAKTEASDALSSSGTVVTLGTVSGSLTKTEANDVVAGAGLIGAFVENNGNVIYLKPRTVKVYLKPRPTEIFLKAA